MCHVDGYLLVRESGETDAASAIDHVHGVVHRARRRRAFDDVIDSLAGVELLHLGNHVRRLADVDHRVRA